MVHRLSPSGPFVVSNRLRWYGSEPFPNLVEQTGFYNRAEFDFDNASDPVVNLVQLGDTAYATEGTAYPLGQFHVQRLVGFAAGPILPTGDADIVIQLQRYNAATATQEDLGEPIEFGVAEFGKKVINIGELVPVDDFIFLRATYPDNWDPGNKLIQIYSVLDLVN